MTGSLAGALLGLLVASGALLAVRAAPPMRPIRLVDRMAPYLVDTAPASKLLARPSASATPFAVARRLLGPLLGEAVGLVDRLVGGTASVRRRLGGLGSRLSVEEFRIEQVVWGTCAMVGGALLVALAGILHGQVDAVLVAGAALAGLFGGVLGRDWWLSHQLERREQAMLSEFPVVADLLALAIIAGEAPPAALQRVCRLTGGELARDLDSALARARAGQPITAALTELAERTSLEPFGRFVEGLVVALERGTPLANVLRAQAVGTCVRSASGPCSRRAGGRKSR